MHSITAVALVLALCSCVSPSAAPSRAQTPSSEPSAPQSEPRPAGDVAAEPSSAQRLSEPTQTAQTATAATAQDAARATATADAPNAPARRTRGDDNVHRRAGAAAAAVPELDGLEREIATRAAFAELEPDAQREFIGWFGDEARYLQTFQSSLMRFVIESEPTDPGLWPELEPATWFDPKVHADKQPIARHALARDDSVVLAARAQILGNVEPRRLRSSWIYDYVSREPRRLPDESDPLRVFDNALCGMPPDWDYVEALVERALDDGSQQRIFAAFAHAYTDRSGGVYPGITLYDAYASRTEIEMPDVDTLGIVHDVLNDWDTWKSIVPPDQFDSLYAKIGELFVRAHHHRSLRENLARAYLCGSTELRDGYQHNLERFHALWEEARSTPSDLAARLPSSEKWGEFLQELGTRLDSDETAFLKGVRRHFALDDDSRQVRALLLRLFDQYRAEHGSPKR
jgi:hypothetical protein